MTFKIILALCASAFILQATSAQCINYNNAANGCGCGAGINIAPTSGGNFPVEIVGPYGATGLAVSSDNLIEGPVNVYGTLPFVSAVVLDGIVPSGGQAGVSYSCGNNNVGITSLDNGAGASYGAGAIYGAGLGYGYGQAGSYGTYGSCGCNNY